VREGHGTSSAGGDRGEKEGKDAGHLIHQFLIVIQRYSIDGISRTDSVMIGKNEWIGENNVITQK
jgi:hypothetical protein